MSNLKRLWEEQVEEIYTEEFYCETLTIDERGIEYTSFHASGIGSALSLEDMLTTNPYSNRELW